MVRIAQSAELSFQKNRLTLSEGIVHQGCQVTEERSDLLTLFQEIVRQLFRPEPGLVIKVIEQHVFLCQ